MFDWLADAATEFISWFQRGAETFNGLVVGIVPLLIVLLTAVNALIALIGPERVNKFGEWAGREGFAYTPIRYLVWPVISVFVLTNPMAYTNGSFLPEIYKPGFYDSAVSFRHWGSSRTSTRASSSSGAAFWRGSSSWGSTSPTSPCGT